MNYEELENILNPDEIALPVITRPSTLNADFCSSRTGISGHRLSVSANHEDQKAVFVSSRNHCKGSDLEASIHPMTEADGAWPEIPEFATLRFSSEEKFKGSVMDGVRHDDEVRVCEDTTVFLSVSDLIDLRTEINRAIREARINNINVPQGA